MPDSSIHPFTIDVPQTEVDDLRDRLARTRWPDALDGVGWSYGTPVEEARALAQHWAGGFDWRVHEARLNAHPQYLTEIDGTQVHFVHAPSPEPHAVPLLLTHGWPGTFEEYVDLVGPLTDPQAHGGDPADAFHVVIPSLPGFGFSGPPREAGWGVRRISEALAELMARLGYERFAAAGNDFGSMVSRELGVFTPERLLGVHVTQLFSFPSGDPAEFAGFDDEDRRRLAALEHWDQSLSGYAKIQSTRPQTLGVGLNDSPAGLLSWMLDFWEGFGENAAKLDRDRILTNIGIYWFTQTAASAARAYLENAVTGGWDAGEPNTAPTALAMTPRDFQSIRPFARRDNPDIVRWTEFDDGGHFASMELPDLWLDDLRAFFADRR